MATCKICRRDGLFLSVNQHGLCSTCNTGLAIEAESRLRVLNESVKIIESTKNLATRLSRCNVVIEQAQALIKYENLGIPVITPPPSKIAQTYLDNKLIFVKEGLLEDSRQALEKAKLASTTNAKVTALSKVVLKIMDYKREYTNVKDLEIMENGLRKAIQEIQLSAFLDDAKKAEFKGNKKKALDKYYEALYFLQHDDVDDALQRDSINNIEAKIKEFS